MDTPDPELKGRQLWTGYLVAPANAGTNSVPLGRMLGTIFKAWRIWMSTGFIGGLIGVALALWITPIYKATAVIAIESQGDSMGSGLLGGQLTGLAGLAGISLGGANHRMEYLAVLDSRSLADLFIAENGLKQILFADRWDAVGKRWTSKKVPTDDDAFRFFSQSVCNVDEDRRTGLVAVSMEWKDREAAARWANLYVRRANDLLRDRAMFEAKSSLEFLDRELATASTIEIRAAMYQLVEAQKKQQMLATVRKDYIFHIVDPAVVPDAKRFIKPKRALFAAACAFAAFIAGLAFALYRDRKSLQVPGNS